jgi:hypothetical protein
MQCSTVRFVSETVYATMKYTKCIVLNVSQQFRGPRNSQADHGALRVRYSSNTIQGFGVSCR